MFVMHNPVMFTDPSGLFAIRASRMFMFAFSPKPKDNPSYCKTIGEKGGGASSPAVGSGPGGMRSVDEIMEMHDAHQAARNANRGSNQAAGTQATTITRGTHATIRASEGRNVSTTINDVQRARPADVLVQNDGRWVIRGQGGRIHVLESGGEIVTTMNRVTQSNVTKKINSGEWSRLTLEQQQIFLDLFGNYVNWQY